MILQVINNAIKHGTQYWQQIKIRLSIDAVVSRTAMCIIYRETTETIFSHLPRCYPYVGCLN